MGGPDANGWVIATELVSRVEELESAVEALDAELDEKVQDVRERVIQVKHGADAKAPADHDHADLSQDVERHGRKLDALTRDVENLDDDLAERLDAVDDRLTAGFDNFEEVLEYLLETTDALNGKVGTLARATHGLRKQAERLATRVARRDAADRLRTSAHEHGVTKADCESCGGTVHLGLLTSPDCPHCAARITGVEPRTGFFRSSVLHTGERPALEGEVEGDSPDLAPLIESDGPTAPSVDDLASATSTSPPNDEAESERTSSERDEPTGSPGTAAAAEGLDSVSGIGPAYEERLHAAGVETVGDLALVDPARLADSTGIAPGRLETLVHRARERVGSE